MRNDTMQQYHKNILTGMKTITPVLLILAALLITIYSCKKNADFVFDEITIEGNKEVEEGYRLLHVQLINTGWGDSLWLGLGMHANYFYLDMNTANSDKAYDVLKWSKDNFKPLKIRFFKESGLIAAIKMPTAEETKEYLSKFKNIR